MQIKGCNSCLEEICDFHPRGHLCSNRHYDKCDQWENTYPGMIGKNPKRDFSLFLRIGVVVDLNYFGRKNQVYYSTVGVTRQFGFYVIVVTIMPIMTTNLVIFIWQLPNVIPHLKTLYVTLLQIDRLKHVNFTI